MTAASYERVSTESYKKAYTQMYGQIIATTVFEISGDGETLTATITAVEGPLAGTPTVMVYERK